MVFWLVEELVKSEPVEPVKDEKHEYPEEERKTIEELLRPPMTLAQGAAIMNDIIRKRDGDRLITEERPPSPFAPRLIINEGKPYEG